MKRYEFYYQSADKKTNIHAVRWTVSYTHLAFFIGVLFEVENWAEMVKFPVTFFAVTYIECHYTYSKSE